MGFAFILGGQRLWRSGRQVAVEAGAGTARFLNERADGETFVAQVRRVVRLRRIDNAGPADTFSLSGGDGAGVGCRSIA